MEYITHMEHISHMEHITHMEVPIICLHCCPEVTVLIFGGENKYCGLIRAGWDSHRNNLLITQQKDKPGRRCYETTGILEKRNIES